MAADLGGRAAPRNLTICPLCDFPNGHKLACIRHPRNVPKATNVIQHDPDQA